MCWNEIWKYRGVTHIEIVGPKYFKTFINYPTIFIFAHSISSYQMVSRKRFWPDISFYIIINKIFSTFSKACFFQEIDSASKSFASKLYVIFVRQIVGINLYLILIFKRDRSFWSRKNLKAPQWCSLIFEILCPWTLTSFFPV